MNKAYLLIGSNEGNRLLLLRQATEQLASEAGNIEARSSIYETASWGNEDLPNHLNQALIINTYLSATDLLRSVQAIENDLGRKRQDQWGLRTIDIDIIFFNDEVISHQNLSIPHPLLQERKFVLTPLQEIAGNYIHPIFNKTVSDLLLDCKDNLSVKKWIFETNLSDNKI